MKYRVQNIVDNEYLDDDGIFLLPNGEVGWFIRDGSYPHYRKFGHQEDFKVINEDCERLQKQLDIALKIIDAVMQDEYTMETIDGGLSMYMYTGLEKIKELENEIPNQE